MKQVLQNLGNGETLVEDIPCPKVRPGALLIRTRRSVISAGTERMLVEFGAASLLKKAKSQPGKVLQVLDKIRTDGLAPALEAVRSRLGEPLPMGYCNAGEVVEIGEGVEGFRVGDRVASNGPHAEMALVPKNLVAKIPAGVGDESAAFTVMGAIALQGIRLTRPTLGEGYMVIGLGLIGLVTVQLLRAHGVKVLGVDLDPSKLELARGFGAETVDLSKGEDPVRAAMELSGGRGMDAALITASTRSSEPVSQAAKALRKRGRIVLVGVTGLELDRADFYEKEITFQVSCSYGPGRYDPEYEEKGHDYPPGFVRWTEQRNFEAVLGMMAEGKLVTEPLVSARYPIERAAEAYKALTENRSGLGIVIEYPSAEERPVRELAADEVIVKPGGRVVHPAEGGVSIGFIGAGVYAGRVLIPAFRQAGARLVTVASLRGLSAASAARKHGFENATTDVSKVMDDERINTVVIATRHDSHADLVCAALDAGKNVFVEKPLAVSADQLSRIKTAYEKAARDSNPPVLMVGFNRRFSPFTGKIRSLTGGASKTPKSFIMTVNAGPVPQDHWTRDSEIGGGRVIGEACHFIDLLRHLAGAPVSSFHVSAMRGGEDTVSVTLEFEDGSVGTVHYFSNGARSYPKERLEIFSGGGVLHLDNFRELRGYGFAGFGKMKLWRQDKGNTACAAVFVESVKIGAPSPIPFEEIMEVGGLTIEIAQTARS